MDEFRDTLDDATDGEPPSDTAQHPVAWILAFFAAAVVALAVIQYFWPPRIPARAAMASAARSPICNCNRSPAMASRCRSRICRAK